MLCGLLKPDGGSGQCLGYDIIDRAARNPPPGRLHDPALQPLRGPDGVREPRLRRPRLRDAEPRGGRPARSWSAWGSSDRRNQLAGQLSGGWKQRLALAACVLHQPKLLLLDEPTAGVDAKARREFWDLIHDMAVEGLTTLVSTHYMDEAERCKRIVYLAQGRIVVQGGAAAVVAAFGPRRVRGDGRGRRPGRGRAPPYARRRGGGGVRPGAQGREPRPRSAEAGDRDRRAPVSSGWKSSRGSTTSSSTC